MKKMLCRPLCWFRNKNSSAAAIMDERFVHETGSLDVSPKNSGK